MRAAADYRSQVLADRAVGYWRLNEAAGSALDETGRLSLVPGGGALTYGQPGALGDGNGSVLFSGAANAQFNGPSPPEVAIWLDAGLGSASYEAWFKTTSAARNGIWRKSDTSNGLGPLLDVGQLTAGSLRLQVGAGGPSVNSPLAYNDGLWHHVVAVLDRPAALLRLYVDGLQVATSDASSLAGVNLVPTASTAALGAVSGSNFIGNLDEAAIYQVALSAQQVLAHYRSGLRGVRRVSYAPVIKFDKPVAYWRLGEASGAFVEQIAANNGAANGGLARAQDGAVADGDLACGFDGSTGFISFSGINVSQGDFTLEAWVKPTGFVNGHNHVLTGGIGCPAMDVNQSGVLYATEVSTIDAPLSGATVPLNVWSHLAITFLKTGQIISYYLNGTLVSSQAWPSYSPGGANAHTRIGLTSGYASAWLGLIDEVAIYAYALSTAQLLDHYLMGTSGRRTRVAA